MTNFTENYEQYSKEAIKEANQFIEKSKGLYTNEDMPAFIAGYLQACLKTPQTKPHPKCDEACMYLCTAKPLSDAEIIKLTPWDKNPYELYTEMEFEDLIKFARAIEERILGNDRYRSK